MSDMLQKNIGDYAIIGDGETAALVGKDGSIDWLCMPRFDSSACFAALLGNTENGCWSMRPVKEIKHSSRSYLGDTLILETVMETETGVVAIIDFMPIRGEAPDIVRIVECREGEVEMSSQLALRFDYGQFHPLVQALSDVRAIAIAGPDAVALDFDAPINFEDRWFTSRFTVKEGDRSAFVLTWFQSFKEPPQRVDPEKALKQTKSWWTKWAGHIDYDGHYRDEVVRSLISLKALIHHPSGGIIAAPTSSLPERPGGARNWDYRFCWLRDATFTLLAFVQAGLKDEAEQWVAWLRRAAGGEPIDLQPFYTVDGDRRSIEWEADWLDGFNGAKPVRFGNGAVGQLQLDIYGEVIDTLYFAAQRGMTTSEDADILVRLLAENLAEVWDQPDAGIWESRGGPKQHVYSKVMCWVAFDRAACWFAERDEAFSERCRELAQRIHALVCEEGFHPQRNAFTQTFGEEALDASALRIPLVGFLPADDERVRSTVAAIERELVRDGFVLRYSTEKTDDGVGGSEGAFIAASFWLADVYALQGRQDDACNLFEHLLKRANDVYLLSEELSWEDRRLLGNFPQGLSHLSLVSTAMNLQDAGGPGHARSVSRKK
ncbi:glycoside hydrolase family 15 protein [Stakelama sediminis]|uniref:GH15 family glucan-1,4-alpha-glucosidase n=1 Tax=Stakelama sediminis TaxID=463200 RepID=A0A840YV62_9SPHN|nr:glycoside hydrolase family 15 protein [Stakelama sediminis]MBB5717424.1 GH15 family glucan-1,4-alpha-glucosidase [Stakelama sediminis]